MGDGERTSASTSITRIRGSDDHVVQKEGVVVDVTPLQSMDRIGPFCFQKKTLPKKSIVCLTFLASFYTEKKLETLLYAMATNTFDISRRALEYACVNYTKKENVTYPYIVNGQETIVHVSDQYDRWLEQWNRRNFDFFRRYARIFFCLKDELHETTVGQAHIMYWADQYGVIEYVRANLHSIILDMSETHGRNRRDKLRYRNAGIKRKRQRLVRTPQGQCFIYEMNVRLQFNDTTTTT